jgi:hypothetical protein
MHDMAKKVIRNDYEKYPELFADDSRIDPRTRKRTVLMRILNLSFPRTGTVCALPFHCWQMMNGLMK